jgi:hypothetical protein
MKLVLDEIVEEALRELSDERAQRKLWRSDGEAEVSSLAEVRSRLWDDSGLADAMERGVVYNSEVDAQLRRLDRVLEVLDDNTSVDTLLDSSQLATARSLAAELLEALRGLGYDEAGA